jgi:hypothetical protein
MSVKVRGLISSAQIKTAPATHGLSEISKQSIRHVGSEAAIARK